MFFFLHFIGRRFLYIKSMQEMEFFLNIYLFILLGNWDLVFFFYIYASSKAFSITESNSAESLRTSIIDRLLICML